MREKKAWFLSPPSSFLALYDGIRLSLPRLLPHRPGRLLFERKVVLIVSDQNDSPLLKFDKKKVPVVPDWHCFIEQFWREKVGLVVSDENTY